MLIQEIIAAKRDRHELDRTGIEAFVLGLTDGSVTDAQAASLAMAILLNGMSQPETAALTDAMARSGRRLDWSAVAAGRPVIDKHSTGGVGDTVSLMLAPALAACGALVPMISGRGLGHTGGTLDKLDAIPGYQTRPDPDTFARVAGEVGCAIIGQTGDLAPADGRLYAIRDVTATVESIPLITASILSKKLAAGLDALVLDVKTGSGAFARTRKEADTLASSLIEVAAGLGLRTAALITDMDQPLAPCAGNALEVLEAIDFLVGNRRSPRLEAVTIALGGAALALCRLAPNAEEGERRIRAALDSGDAAAIFARMVAALGGPADFIDRPRRYLEAAPITRAVPASASGRVTSIDTAAIGLAVIELGGGRRRPEDSIDHRVGLTELAGIGDDMGPDRPLCLVHARDAAGFVLASERIRVAYRIDAGPAHRRDAVLARIEAPRP